MKPIAPILRSKEQARRFYSRISTFYDLLTASEKPLIMKGIAALHPLPGESILEIGCATGIGLGMIERIMEGQGFSLGLDLSYDMLQACRKKTSGNLLQGDAGYLPLSSAQFDGVFCSFTLELFSQDQIEQVLKEIRRVLKPEGRLLVAALSSHRENLATKLYGAAHRLFPVAVDCRPIPVDRILQENGYEIRSAKEYMNWGLPILIVEGRPN